jgi:hypothetical protein
MKRKIFIPAIILMFIALPNIHCSKDSGSGDLFIPDLQNTWVNQSNSDNTFFFLADSTNTNSSTFTGNENLPGGGGQDHFTGSFTNHNIRFTYDTGSSGNKSGKTFIGTINDASTLMTFQSNDLGSLVLQKQ